MKILVVEHRGDLADAMVNVLVHSGHDVRLVYNGLSGVEEAASFLPDSALIDIDLPLLNGMEVARTIRRARANQVLLIAITEYIRDEQMHQDILDAGFDQVIRQPAAADDLLRALEIPGT